MPGAGVRGRATGLIHVAFSPFSPRAVAAGWHCRRDLCPLDWRRPSRRSFSGRCDSRVDVAAGHHGRVGGHATGEPSIGTGPSGCRTRPVPCRRPRRPPAGSAPHSFLYPPALAKPLIPGYRGRDGPDDRGGPAWPAARGRTGTERRSHERGDGVRICAPLLRSDLGSTA